jgi:NitT/TauT family transport system substrate-binding protein
MYARSVYPGQKVLGEMNVERLTKLQAFYLSKGIIEKATPIDELFTNEFIGG